MKPYTKIGCEAYIIRNNQLLMGLRGRVHGEGTWALPGGHMKYQERADTCLIRELSEEMGLAVDQSALKLLAVTDDLEPVAGSHYVHLTFAVDIGTDQPKLLEPEACDEWRWFDIEKLPSNIYPPHAKILATIASGQTYKIT